MDNQGSGDMVQDILNGIDDEYGDQQPAMPPPMPQGPPRGPPGPSLPTEPMSSGAGYGGTSGGLVDRIMQEGRTPAAVALIFFILSFATVADMINTTMSKYLGAYGSNTTLQLVARSLLAGVAFYVVQRFVL